MLWPAQCFCSQGQSTAAEHSPGTLGYPQGQRLTVFAAWIQYSPGIFRFCLLKQKAAEQSLHFRRRKGCPVAVKWTTLMHQQCEQEQAEGGVSPISLSPAQPWQQRADNSLPLADWQEAFTTATAGRTFQVPNILPAGSYAHFSCKMPLFASHHHLPPSPNPSFPVLCSPTTVSFTRNHQAQG